MSATPGTARQHISSTPGVCGGKPCVAGTRIRVQDIYVWHELEGRSADEIVHDFPQLSIADVHAALAYFWDNRAAILGDMERGAQLAESLKPKTPTKLPARPGNADTVSP